MRVGGVRDSGGVSAPQIPTTAVSFRWPPCEVAGVNGDPGPDVSARMATPIAGQLTYEDGARECRARVTLGRVRS
jgi:hypothetical protein